MEELSGSEFRVVYIYAGQGDCTLILFPNGQKWLIDCGSTSNIEEAKQTIRNVLEK